MKNIDVGLLILRVSLGVLLLLHGIAKIYKGVEPIEGMIEQTGLPGVLAYGVFLGGISSYNVSCWI